MFGMPRLCRKDLKGVSESSTGNYVWKGKKPNLRMGVVCDIDLHIWHFMSGLPGMLNDIHIMWM